MRIYARDWFLGILLSAVACHPKNADLTCSISDWDNARLLLDCFQVQELSLTTVTDSDGAAVVPASFTWRAPDDAEMVVCAVFVDVPRFDAQGITNFDDIAAYYSVKSFPTRAPREGSFDLEAALQRSIVCPWKIAGAGCLAYSFTEVIAASPLRELTLAGAPGACVDQVCTPSKRRFGREIQGECLPFCTVDLAPQCDSCEAELCRGLSRVEPDGGAR